MLDLDGCYRLLELDVGATLAEVNQAYKDLVFIWHPDRIPKDNTRLIEKAQEKIKLINQAREHLRSHLQNPTSEPRKATAGSRRQHYHSYQSHPPHQNRQPYTHQQRSQASPSQGRSAYSYTSNPYAYRSYTQPNGETASHSTADRPRSGQHPPPQPDSYHSPPREPNTYRSSSAYTQTDPSAGPRQNKGKDLTGVNLRGANLSEKDFEGRNLSHADLAGADLSDAFLHRVNLHRANLHQANLFRANLLHADLSYADLREANLVGADLSGADLRGADLRGAKVGQGNRILVKLTGAHLHGAIMPDGHVHE